jgi:hypothetical protein
VGNVTPDHLEALAANTVKGPVDALRKQFFPKLPARLITIYLLADDASYRHYAWEIFRDRPSTPYGYVRGDSMIMNIATGGGTLVHELVHTLMAANFPSAPAWFNEGLGSLFEQCNVEESRLVGLVNWRLPGLQKALKDDCLVPLATLIATSDKEFYADASGLHYAEARYLCMYLQEMGKLETFYRLFHGGFARDRTGCIALEKAAGMTVDKIEKEWSAWVLTLSR